LAGEPTAGFVRAILLLCAASSVYKPSASIAYAAAFIVLNGVARRCLYCWRILWTGLQLCGKRAPWQICRADAAVRNVLDLFALVY
jgi:hypothetical protein